MRLFCVWNGPRWKIAARTHAPHRNTYILRWTTWQKTTGSLPRPRRNTNSGEKFNNINISMCVKMCICLFILLQTYFQFRQLPCSAARQLCQMQRICLAATLVQGCHNEAKAFFGAVFTLKPQHHLCSALLQRWPCYLGVGGSSPNADTFACMSVHLSVHFTAKIFPSRVPHWSQSL